MFSGLNITGIKLTSPAPTKKVPSKPKEVSVKVPPKKPSTVSKNIKAPIKLQVSPNMNKSTKIEQISIKPTMEIQAQKVEEVKIEMEILPPKQYYVIVRYNHYKEKFPVLNDVLDFFIIDQKYAFSLVFKGKYYPILKLYLTKEEIEKEQSDLEKRVFKWKVCENTQYVLEIKEDQEQESKYQKKVYKAVKQENDVVLKKKKKVDDLTEEMKKMGIDELGGEKHRQMLEQRDLEDILFS